MTGSHNWSSNAENSNNENTLIIKSNRIANLYLQEFSSRYTEAGGTDILLGVSRVGNEVPTSFSISQNYPNPFNPTTAISFQLSADSRVLLTVYDLLGREVATLVNREMAAGTYRVSFDGTKLSSGVYIYTFTAGGFSESKKMVLLR
ncbi:MAG: T9SS type A sorting domain-containing protein [Ignavibacteriales bacterium]|nr:T9SS type A sorting domain-containing protein [Ignavibacteriales bacterium]